MLWLCIHPMEVATEHNLAISKLYASVCRNCILYSLQELWYLIQRTRCDTTIGCNGQFSITIQTIYLATWKKVNTVMYSGAKWTWYTCEWVRIPCRVLQTSADCVDAYIGLELNDITEKNDVLCKSMAVVTNSHACDSIGQINSMLGRRILCGKRILCCCLCHTVKNIFITQADSFLWFVQLSALGHPGSGFSMCRQCHGGAVSCVGCMQPRLGSVYGNSRSG